MDRARNTIVYKINKAKNSGQFVGSEGEIYQTALDSCSCQDFIKRGGTCKHMYRLSHELGIMQLSGKINNTTYCSEASIEGAKTSGTQDEYDVSFRSSSVIKVVSLVFGFVAAIGIAISIAGILYGGGVIFGTMLAIVCFFIGVMLFYASSHTSGSSKHNVLKYISIILLVTAVLYALIIFADFGNFRLIDIVISSILGGFGLLIIIVSRLLSRNMLKGNLSKEVECP
jgi:hypothetical protein